MKTKQNAIREKIMLLECIYETIGYAEQSRDFYGEQDENMEVTPPTDPYKLKA